MGRSVEKLFRIGFYMTTMKKKAGYLTQESRKKICYILPFYDENTATHYRYLYDFIERVSKEADIFLLIEKTKETREIIETFSECTYVKFQKFSFLPLRFFENLFFITYAQKKGYKNIYIHYSYISAFSAALLSKLIKLNVFYWNCGMPWLYRTSLLREKIFKFILRNTFLVTGTETLKHMYSNIYNLNINNVHILPNWINIKKTAHALQDKNMARQKLGVSSSKKIILFIHHLSKRKGADILPDVISLLKERKDIFFIIVGGGPEYDFLKNAINKNNLSPLARLEGPVPNYKIPLYLSASDIFFMPSEEEGFPRVLLESMTAGVPYVASAVGGVLDFTPEALTRYTVSNKKRNPENYAKKIEELLSDNTNYSESLKRHVLKYDINAVVSRFIDLF